MSRVLRVQSVLLLWLPLAGLLAAAEEPSQPRSPTDQPSAAKVEGVVQRLDGAEVQQFDWGEIRWLISSKVDPKTPLTVGLVEIKPNQSNPLHIHPNCDECLHVLAGSCEHRLGEQWFSLKAGDTLRIPKNVVHQARTGQQPCRAMVVYDTGAREMVVVDPKK